MLFAIVSDDFTGAHDVGLVLAGGATAGAVCRHLEITATQILCEIETGTVLAAAMGARPLGLVIKPGAFGSTAFIEKAVLLLHGVAAAGV